MKTKERADSGTALPAGTPRTRAEIEAVLDLLLSAAGLDHTPAALAYTAPTLLNGWANFVGWAAAGYTKDNQGLVHLKGLLKDGVTAVGTPIFKLPVGYRPSENRVFSVATFNGTSLIHARVDVGSNGDVETGVQDNNVQNTWLSLDGISFVAA